MKALIKELSFEPVPKTSNHTFIFTEPEFIAQSRKSQWDSVSERRDSLPDLACSGCCWMSAPEGIYPLQEANSNISERNTVYLQGTLHFYSTVHRIVSRHIANIKQASQATMQAPPFDRWVNWSTETRSDQATQQVYRKSRKGTQVLIAKPLLLTSSPQTGSPKVQKK